jgi:hypothetical protein
MNAIVVISKQPNNRISVSVPWDKDVIEYFHTIEQRKWCKDNKEWSFPSVNLENIHNKLSLKYKIVIRDNQPIVHILQRKGSHSEVTCEYDPAIIKIINDVPQTHWDSMKRVFLMPNEHIYEFCSSLDSQHISFETSCPPEPKEVKRKMLNTQVFCD